MFPRPVSMKNNQAILKLVARLEKHKLVAVVQDRDRSQRLQDLTKDISREFLVATDGQVYLLADIIEYLATASAKDIQTSTLAFRGVTLVSVSGVQVPVYTSIITLSELKASPKRLTQVEFLIHFKSLLTQLNLRNYSIDSVLVDSYAQLQRALAMFGSRNFDASISSTVAQIKDAKEFHTHLFHLGFTDFSLVDATDIENLDEPTLLWFAAQLKATAFVPLAPNSIITDAWLCTIAVKIKFKAQLTAKFAQTNDVDLKKALQHEITTIDKSIMTLNTFIKHLISTQKIAYKVMKLAEDKYQAHILKSPNLAADDAAQMKLDVKTSAKATGGDKAFKVLGFIAKALTAILFVSLTLGLAIAGGAFLIFAVVLNPVALAVLGVLACIGAIAASSLMLHYSNKILKAAFNRIDNFGDYLKQKLFSSSNELTTNAAINEYANSRSASITQEIAEREMGLKKLQAVLAKITALDTECNVNAAKEAKQRVKGNVIPTGKIAGTLFSAAQFKPVVQTATPSSLRRNSR